MTKRTKLVVCVGLVALAAGVVVVCAPARKPQVELTFVRYTNCGPVTCAVLQLTNRSSARLIVHSRVPFSSVLQTSPTHTTFFRLPHGSSTQFVAWPGTSLVLPGEASNQIVAKFPSSISLAYWPEGILYDLIGIASSSGESGRVVSVTIPPK